MIATVVWGLCMKMNVPQEEAEQCVRKVRERQMGYWFENMEKMDIQEERQNTAKAREEAEKARVEAEKVRAEAIVAIEREKENTVKAIISLCQKLHASEDTALKEIMDKCGLDIETAREKMKEYWK